MRAVVLVGGFGTRLRPLTEAIPKPLLPVGQRPIIEHVVTRLRDGGVDDVVLALGFRPDAFRDAYPDGTCAGVPLHYAVESEPLDTAGAIAFAARQAGVDDTFVVVNGDVLTDLDVSELIRFHRGRGAEATIHLTPVEDPSAFGVVEPDEHGRVVRFVEKPPPGTAPTNLISAGTYVFEPSMVERVPLGARVSVERVVFPAVVAEGGLYALSTDDYWIDTGRPDLYLRANLDAVNGRRPALSESPVGDGASIAGTVVDSVVGAGARIGAGACVTGSVVLPRVDVGETAIVTGSILGPDARVGAGASLVDVVLGAGAVVDAGEHLSQTRRPVPA
jgi:mannose-1-phosphate guanylyltransferase